MKLRLFFLFFLSIAMTAKADDINAIKVLMEDGTSQIFMLEDDPYAKFEGDMLVIASKKQELSVSMQTNDFVQVMYINNYDLIRDIGNGLQTFYRITDFGLEATGLKPGTEFYVYDINGTVSVKAVVGQDGTVKVALKGNGVYVVKTSISSLKIKK